MLEKLVEIDRELFVYLNGLGSEPWDEFWRIITDKLCWIPVFAIILYLAFKRLGWKHALLVIGMIAVLLLITDQSVNLVKNTVQRLRPVNEPALEGLMRVLERRRSFSFMSGHAANSMAVAFFLYRVLHPYIKYMGFFFIWPAIFAYSRIYLGLHYPGDILVGYLWGLFTGFLVLKLYVYLRDRYFPQHEKLDNPTNSEPVTNG